MKDERQTTNPARRANRLVRRGAMPFALEQRFMFDGAAVVDAAQTATAHADTAVDALKAEALAEKVAVEQTVPAHSAGSDAQAPTLDAKAPVELTAGIVRDVPNAREILFIDAAVTDKQTLIRDARDGVTIVILDSLRDAWQQMTEVIAQHQNLEAIHLVSHGAEGNVILNGIGYNAQSLQAEAEYLNSWQAHLTDTADILIYGCDVAAGADGQLLINDIARLTHADVAASTDVTGARAYGGDWVLEAQTGRIETSLFASSTLLADYQGELAVAPVTVAFASGSDSGTSGDGITNVTRPSFTFTPSAAAGSYVLTIDGTAQSAVAAAISNGTPFTFQVPANLSGAGRDGTSHTVSFITWSNGSGGGTQVNSGSFTFTIDTTTPTLAITSVGGDNIVTSTSDSTVLGTASDAGKTVTLYSGAAVLGTATASNTVNGSGTYDWSYALTAGNLTTLGNGAGKSITASESDTAGNSGTASAFTFSVNQLTAPSISAVIDDVSPVTATYTNSGLSTNDTNLGVKLDLTSTGASAGDTIQLYNGSTTASPLGSSYTITSTDVTNKFANVSTGTLSNATTYSITARITSAGTQSSASAAFVVTIDTTPPSAPSLLLGTGVSGGATVAEATQGSGVITVAGESGASIAVTFTNGVHSVTKTVTGTGAAQAVTLSAGDLTTLTDGTISVSAVVTDTAGNASTSASTAFTLDTGTPGVTIASIGGDNIVTSSSDTLVLGTATEAGRTVSIYAGATLLGTATAGNTANGGGTYDWSYALTQANLTTIGGNGTGRTITASQNDLAGNTGSTASFSFTIAELLPPSITAVTDDVSPVTGTTLSSPLTTNDTDLRIRLNLSTSGAIAGNTIQLYDGATTTSPLGSLYTITSTDISAGYADLATGTLINGTTYSITARVFSGAVDGGASSAFTVTVDTVPPTVSSVAITGASGALNSTLSVGDTVQITLTMSEATLVTGTPQVALNIGGTTVYANYVSGSGTAALVFSHTIQSGASDSNGISIGANAVSLNGGTLADAAGNAAILATSAMGDNAGYLVDTAPPGAPTLALGTDVSGGATATEATQAAGVVTVSGEGGASIAVTFARGANTITRTLVGTGSAQAVTLSAGDLATLGDGTISVSAVVTDAAGNASSAGSTSFILDTAAPSDSLTGKPASVVKNTTATFTWSGNDTGGSGVTAYEYRVDGGSWTLTAATTATVSSLTNGSHTFEVRAIDAAGNIQATPVAHTWTVDPLLREPSLSAANSEFGVLQQGTNFDPVNDTQSNAADTDLVGDANTPLLLGAYDSTSDAMYFRLRIGDPTMVKVGTDYVPRFTGVAMIGLDVNGDGKLDVMVGVDGRNSGLGVVLYDPGTGANDRPSTTSIMNQTAAWSPNDLTLGYDTTTKASYTANYRYELIKVTPTDVGASDGQDAYLTFKIPFNVIVSHLAVAGGGRATGITHDADGNAITASSSFRYGLFTLTQNNSINGDVGGIGKGDMTRLWSDIANPISFTKPTLLGISGNIAYSENAAAKALAPAATLTDLDTSNFKGSTLQLDLGATLQSGDELTVLSGGNNITVSGRTILYNGSAIGSYDWNVTATGKLTVTLGGAGITGVSADAIQALVRNLAYRNTSENPSPVTRTVSYHFTDPDSNVSPVTSISIAVEAINDAPTIAQTGALNRTVFNSVAYDISNANDTTARLLAAGVPSGIAIADVDAASLTVEARLSVDKGVLDLYDDTALVGGSSTKTFSFTAGGTPYSIDVLGASTSTLVLRGSVDAINAFLAGSSAAQIIYQPGSIPGTGTQTASLSLTVHDLANTGTGGDLTATRMVGTISVTGEPLLLGTFTSSVREDNNVTLGNLATAGAITVANGSTLAMSTAATYLNNTLSSAALGALTIDSTGHWAYTVSNAQAAIQALTASGSITETFKIQGNVTKDGVVSPAIGYIEVTITGVNDAPTLTATGGSRTYREGTATATSLFTGATAEFGAGETGQTLTQLALTVTNVVEGDQLVLDGTAVAIDTASAAAMTTLSGHQISVTLSGTTATLTIQNVGASAAQWKTLVESIGYRSTSDNPTALNTTHASPTRTITINSLTDSGGTVAGGQDTASLAIVATLTITPANDAPSGTDATLNMVKNATRTLTTSDFGYSDPEGDAFTNVRITALPGAGTLTLDGTTVNAGDVVSTADIAAGKLRFQPATGASGSAYASFIFRVNDGSIESAAANTITFNVVDNNTAPSTADAQITITEDSTRSLSASDFFFSDVDAGDSLAGIVLVSTSGSGSFVYRDASGDYVPVTANQAITAAELNSGYLRFVPTPDGNGAAYASLVFQVSDGDKTSGNGTLTVNVTPVNDAPACTDNTVTTLEDQAYTFATADFGFSDPNDAGTNTLWGVKITTLPGAGTLRLDGTLLAAGDVIFAADIAAHKLVFTPAANVNGTGYASFSFQVQDNGGTAHGGTDLDPTANTITIDVTPVNDAPAGTDNTVSTQEDHGYIFTAADFGFSDSSDGAANTLAGVRITTLPGAGILTLNGTALNAGEVVSAVDIAAHKLIFTPATDASGTGYASFTFQVTDNGGTANGGIDLDSTANTITIDVTPVNDAPAGTNNTVTTLEDQAYTFATEDFGFSDTVDSPADALLAVKITTLPGSGVLKLNGAIVATGDLVSAADIAANKLVFTPAADASGTGYASFTFQVQDNGGTAHGGIDLDPNARTISIDITPVNDAPSASNIGLLLNPESAYVFAVSDFGFTDTLDGHAFLAVQFESLPAVGHIEFKDGTTWSDISLDGSTGVARILTSDIAAGKLRYLAPASVPATSPHFDFLVQDTGGTADGGIDTAASSHTVTIDIVPLTIDDILVNEASDDAIFTINGIVGQSVLLTLSNTTAALDLTQTLQIWDNTASDWTNYTGANAVIPTNGTPLYVRIALAAEHDTDYEGRETFQLAVNNQAGTSTVSGTGTIVDDGSGTRYGPTPFDSSTSALDDDRSLSVAGKQDVSEGSNAIFTVTLGAASSVATEISLTLGTPGDTATAGSDYGTTMSAYYDVGLTRTALPITAGKIVLPAGVTAFYVSVPSTQDAGYEGAEVLTLAAAVTNGKSAADSSTIVDDGSGKVYDDRGINTAAPAEDDRSLSVAGKQDVSEGSNAIFTVTLGAASSVATEISLTLGTPGDTVTAGSDYGTTMSAYYDVGLTRTALPITAGKIVLPAGVTAFYVSVPSTQDAGYEGAEVLTLAAAVTNGKSAADSSTIVDDGSGKVYDDLGNATAAKADDDRTLIVDNITVNEASPYAVFRISGSSVHPLQLSLLETGSNYAPLAGNAQLGIDTGTQLQYFDGQGWINYSSGTSVAYPAGSTTLLVRVAINNDNVYEGPESFKLRATAGNLTADGIGMIGDDGRGAIYNESGAENLDKSIVKDDDRALKVGSINVNEGSDYAVLTVTGVAGNHVQLALASTTADSNNATLGTDLGTQLQYFDGDWKNYTTGQFVLLPGDGKLLVRVAIINDAIQENSETFRLTVTDTDAVITSFGTATIHDDGTGLYWIGDATSAATDAQLAAAGRVLDDDFDLDGIAPNVEEILATMSSSTGHGGANGDLNNDGIQDANQSAVTTIAWTTVDKFDAALSGTLTEVKPIISVEVVSNTNLADDTHYQLQDIKVLPTSGGIPDGNITGGRPVGINGETITTPWDPIQFTVTPTAAASGLTDVDPTRAGTQIRIVIDISRSGMTTTDFNAYMKYVTADTMTAAAASGIALTDLDGKAITQAGWYDFTQRKDAAGNHVGDGARFVLGADGKTITAIEITLTDNAFGDDNMAVGKVLDPGLPVLRIAAPEAVQRPPVPVVPAERAVRHEAPRAPTQLPTDEGQRFSYPPFNSALFTLESEASPKNLRFIEATTWPWMPREAGSDERMALSDRYTDGGTWHTLVVNEATANLSVFRGIGDQYADLGAEGKFIVPADAFVHTRIDAKVILDAKQSDGTPLPGWIAFDASTGAFSFMVPENVRSEVKIKVIARDTDGREAAALFRFQIGDKRAPTAGRAGLSDQLREATRFRPAATASERNVTSRRAA